MRNATLVSEFTYSPTSDETSSVLVKNQLILIKENNFNIRVIDRDFRIVRLLQLLILRVK
jgi:hypothetical protein